MASSREYMREYMKTYSKRPKAIKDKASRQKLRYKLAKQGRVKTGDKSKEIDHKDGNPRNNSKSNIRVISKSKNRSKGAIKVNKKRAARAKRGFRY